MNRRQGLSPWPWVLIGAGLLMVFISSLGLGE